MNDDAGGHIGETLEDTRGGVFSLSFLALVATQFFVSLNDNMFRWLVVPIGKELFDHAGGADMPASDSTMDEAENAGVVVGVGEFHTAVSGVCRPGRILGRSFQQTPRHGRLQGGRNRGHRPGHRRDSCRQRAR